MEHVEECIVRKFMDANNETNLDELIKIIKDNSPIIGYIIMLANYSRLSSIQGYKEELFKGLSFILKDDITEQNINSLEVKEKLKKIIEEHWFKRASDRNLTIEYADIYQTYLKLNTSYDLLDSGINTPIINENGKLSEKIIIIPNTNIEKSFNKLENKKEIFDMLGLKEEHFGKPGQFVCLAFPKGNHVFPVVIDLSKTYNEAIENHEENFISINRRQDFDDKYYAISGLKELPNSIIQNDYTYELCYMYAIFIINKITKLKDFNEVVTSLGYNLTEDGKIGNFDSEKLNLVDESVLSVLELDKKNILSNHNDKEYFINSFYRKPKFLEELVKRFNGTYLYENIEEYNFWLKREIKKCENSQDKQKLQELYDKISTIYSSGESCPKAEKLSTFEEFSKIFNSEEIHLAIDNQSTNANKNLNPNKKNIKEKKNQTPEHQEHTNTSLTSSAFTNSSNFEEQTGSSPTSSVRRCNTKTTSIDDKQYKVGKIYPKTREIKGMDKWLERRKKAMEERSGIAKSTKPSYLKRTF